MGDWCILRCSGPATLQLASSLVEVGYDAWSPVISQVRRSDEQRSREEVAIPLISSFVFARSDRLHELLALSHSPSLQYRVWDAEKRKMVVKGHPFFRLFRGGNHRFIPDAELEPLRRLERKPRPKRIERIFAVGDRVRTDEAGFAGLTGKVVEVKRKTVFVAFPKWDLGLELPAWALRPIDEPCRVHVNDALPERDAAKAA